VIKMKSQYLALASVVLASGASFAQRPELSPVLRSPHLVVPPIRREVRAAWVATVWNIDWPTTRNHVTNQRAQMNAILDAAASMRLNALFLQVRSQCDAMYPSTIEPWSFFLTGRMGRAPSPSTYDPLREWIDGARARGIELHAWINPYRALVQTPGTGDSGFIAPNHVSIANPSIVVQYGTQRWLDPGNPATVNHIHNVITDLLNRYDLDGIVFDDYFYPFPIRDENNNIVDFPDSASYNAYLAGGGTLGRADWRRRNVDNFVQTTYQLIKNTRPWVRFGIGPFGIWRPGHPAGVTGLDAFASLFADSRRWIQMGWVDYFAPQLYWAIDDPGQWYDDLLLWWTQQNWQGRHMLASNAAHNLGPAHADWPAEEILDQIEVTRGTPGALGNVFFSMRWLQNNTKSIRTLLEAGLYAEHALPPAATWLDSVPPLPPSVTYTLNRATGQHQIAWAGRGTEATRWFVLSTLTGTAWAHRVLPSGSTGVNIPVKAAGGAPGPLRAFAVASVDRLGNMSSYTNRVLDPTVLSGGGSARD
jgi:uncharacterized lipoprotein YddW (UPF0748 family)